MKKRLIGTILIGAMQLYAQDISCVQFANMSEVEANGYISKIKQDFEVISDDSKESQKNYIKRNYLKTKHQYRCVLLRNAKQSNIDDFKRVKALAQLSKDKLNSSENTLYSSLLRANQNYFAGISQASLVKSDICNYPLVYLSSQLTNKGTLVYEKRLVGNKIKTFSKYINPKSVQMQCGTIVNTENEYLKYLNKKGAKLPLIKIEQKRNDIYSPNFNHQREEKLSEPMTEDYQSDFIVIKKFRAVNFQTGAKRYFKKGTIVSFEDLEANNGDKLFKYKGKTYRVAPYTWEKSVEERD